MYIKALEQEEIHKWLDNIPILNICEFMKWNEPTKKKASGLVLSKNSRNPAVRSRVRPDKCTR
jgi:hypothetical protein